MDDLRAFAGEMEEVAQQLTLYQAQSAEALLDPALAAALVENIQAEYQRLVMAASFYHLPAFSALAAHIDTLLNQYRELIPEAGVELLQLGLLTQWLELGSASLRDTAIDAHLPALHQALTHEAWPEPLPNGLIEDFLIALRQLGQSASDISPTPLPPAPANNTFTPSTTPSHTALRWSPDTHPELLAAYLQETPQQIEQACALMQLITKQQANAEQKRQAVRLAHTIKGSSAVLGIQPLVQFTHRLEDLLELPIDPWLSHGLEETLSAAADHLALLFDNLLSQGELPEQHEALVLGLGAWIDRIKVTPAPVAVSTAQNLSPTPVIEEANALVLPLLPDFITVGDYSETRTTPAPTGSSSAIHVPTEVLQSLLNLAGETITCNARLQAQAHTAEGQLQQTTQHDQRIQRLFEELEDSIENQANTSKINHKTTATDELVLEDYHALYSTYSLLAESLLDTRELNRQLRQTLRDMQEQIQRQKHWQQELSAKLLGTRLVTVSSLINRLERAVRETCRSTNKKARIEFQGTELQLDTDILQALQAPLLHMVRNAIDHGIESPEQRTEQGKPIEGLLTLHFTRHQGHIRITLRDDGIGLNLAAIRTHAEAQGLVSAEQTLSEQEIMQLILLPGFSTRTTVSETSGRGVGMDVVYHAVHQLRGQLRLASEPNQGTSILIEIPLTLVTTQALIARVGKHWVAIPADTITQVVQIDSSAQSEQQGQWVAQFEGATLPVYTLASLLEWDSSDQVDVGAHQSFLLIDNGRERLFLGVDELTTVQDIVVKSSSPWYNLSRFVYGASILPNGHLAPVLDLQRLLTVDFSPQRRYQRHRSGPISTTARQQTTLLVVDDSLSNRKAMTQILEPLGYHVLTARDGYNGLEILRQESVDLILTDLEMPNMNGLELTHALRVWPEKQALPVVMLTSRSTQKHRQMALEAGVNAYLTKPVDPTALRAQLDALLA
ncbi:hybrid sensor histidine kinase/response regulator [Thiofilum flexile]|uniref:hybrid sensor histidine kinase/response regulator n=1 Tax=Thiofilum flexile TaxID=125627 RepID=UPI00036CFCB0|nr:response regulator [Thiofilum flexile]